MAILLWIQKIQPYHPWSASSDERAVRMQREELFQSKKPEMYELVGGSPKFSLGFRFREVGNSE